MNGKSIVFDIDAFSWSPNPVPRMQLHRHQALGQARQMA